MTFGTSSSYLYTEMCGWRTWYQGLSAPTAVWGLAHSRCPRNFFFLIYLFLWLCWVFVSVRGLSPVVASGGPLFIAVRGPLTIAASLVAEHRFQTCRLSNCGSRAQQLRGIWDLPRPGFEPLSPALAGRLSTTVPPGKPPRNIFE